MLRRKRHRALLLRRRRGRKESPNEATCSRVPRHEDAPRLHLDHQLVHPHRHVPPQPLERVPQSLELHQPDLLQVRVQQAGRGTPPPPQGRLQRVLPRPLRRQPLSELDVLPVELEDQRGPRRDRPAVCESGRSWRGTAGEEAADDGVDGGVAEGEGLAGG
ncbi:hypothetical protein MUK42_19252 [Musa troglodytarum]|uniref:Uncharacterized protein n=1 Tax=Musa troglodytarum TaxID=320322 RepID=A0A9E7K1A4_9LILI|nr:hypothetical protein MUK42_19252 [Musa troglodytarum]